MATTVGGPSGERIGGTDEADVIYGMGGDDILWGLQGHDKLYGGDGDDLLANVIGTVQGFDAGDTRTSWFFIGGSAGFGNNLFDGGKGNDRILSVDWGDRALGGADNDTIWLVGAGVADGGSGFDELNINVGGSNGSSVPGMTYNSMALDLRKMWDGGVGTISIDGRHGVLTNFESVGVIMGGGGDDIVWLGDKRGALEGDVGNDLLFGGAGDDAIDGDENYGSIWVTDQYHGDDVIVDTGGNNALNGNGGNDKIYGGTGLDRIDGGAGNDVISGGLGADQLTGDAGVDTFIYDDWRDSTSSAFDVISDFTTGVDKIDLSTLNATSVSISQSGGQYVLQASTAGGVLQVRSSRIIAASDILTTAPIGQARTGGEGKDSLFGGRGGDFLQGAGGDDVLVGDAGGDVLVGGAGADRFTYVKASDSTAAATDLITDFVSGTDRIDLSALNPTSTTITQEGAQWVVRAQTAGGQVVIRSDQVVRGFDLATGPMQLTVMGTSGADVLTASAGGSALWGGLGADVMKGGADRDRFFYGSAAESTGAAADIILDFATGEDTLDFTGMSVNHVSTIVNGGATFVFVETAGGQIMQIGVNGVVQAGDLSGVATNFYMQGNEAANTLVGGAGLDVLDGKVGDDVIIGGGGTDALFGGAGADTFRYLNVRDSLAGAGADTIFDFATGVDKLDLTELSINHISRIINDTADFLFIETKTGEVMQINVVGRIQAADILGGANQYVVGDKEGNFIVCGAGRDTINAGAGADVIVGGGDTDALFGGSGGDVFYYGAKDHSLTTAADTIFDFERGVDKIDLRAVRTGAADKLGLVYATGASYLYVDLGGDGVNDMLIQIGTAGVTLADVLWTGAASPPLEAAAIEGQGMTPPVPEAPAYVDWSAMQSDWSLLQ